MIEIQHLTKQYGDHIAVSDLSISIEAGQIYGFLGPNGAGKSTTMNILTGCLAATTGTVTIDGYDIFEQPNEAKRRIGYLPEQPPVYLDMTPLEYLRFVGEAKGLRGAALRSGVSVAMERTQITGMKDRLIKHLSKGYRQRVGIAQALLGDPQVIILDEPTVGLDPLQIIEIRDLIRSLGREHTVILSSHILSEVAAVCDQIMIISHGKLVAADTAENLTRLMAGSNTLRLTVRGNETAVRTALETIELPQPEAPAGEEPQLTMELDTESGMELHCRPSEDAGCVDVTIVTGPETDLREAAYRAVTAAGLPLLHLSLDRASLEDVFLELTADQPAEAAQPQETYLFGDANRDYRPEKQAIPDAPAPDTTAKGGADDAGSV